jgi:hypothetical protein
MPDESNKPKPKGTNERIDLNAGGLCETCVHVRSVDSAKGSTFLLCTLSVTDPRFPKYPRLPILSCNGYSARE